jgi:hypothetical protein
MDEMPCERCGTELGEDTCAFVAGKRLCALCGVAWETWVDLAWKSFMANESNLPDPPD